MSRKHDDDVKKIWSRHEESVPKSLILDTTFKNFPPRLKEREIKSSWGANLAWFGKPSWGQVAAKLPGSRPKSALVSGLDSEPGSELPFATPVDQIGPDSIDFNVVDLVSGLDSEAG